MWRGSESEAEKGEGEKWESEERAREKGTGKKNGKENADFSLFHSRAPPPFFNPPGPAFFKKTNLFPFPLFPPPRKEKGTFFSIYARVDPPPLFLTEFRGKRGRGGGSKKKKRKKRTLLQGQGQNITNG